VRFNAEHPRIAADVNVTGKRNLLRKRENELDRATCFNCCLDEKVEAPKADVTRFALFFRDAIAGLETDLDGKHHRKSPRCAALYARLHKSSVRIRLRQTTIACVPGAMDFGAALDY
jgi:hypothetical protein